MFCSGDYEFNNPSDVALDSAGNLYVSDLINNRIQVFDATGSYLRTIPTNTETPTPASLSPTDLARPTRLVVDTSNNLYVMVWDQAVYIQKFNSSGSFIRMWGGGSRWWGSPALDLAVEDQYGVAVSVGDITGSPSDLAVDGSGNVYVTSHRSETTSVSSDGSSTGVSRDQVIKFSSTGVFETLLGASGPNEGELSGPSGIVIDSRSNIYVADFRQRVQKLDLNGAYAGVNWGSRGAGDGQFASLNLPIDIDSAGNIYVYDVGNSRIQQFDSDGRFLGKGEIGEMIVSGGIAVDSTGEYVFVSDSTNHRIVKLQRIESPDEPAESDESTLIEPKIEKDYDPGEIVPKPSPAEAEKIAPEREKEEENPIKNPAIRKLYR